MGFGSVLKKGVPGSPGTYLVGSTQGRDLLTGGAYSANKDANGAKAYLTNLQQQGTQQRLANLGSMSAPVQTDATKARIAALKKESEAVPLSQNANFQGDRAQLVQGARQEVGGIQNQNKAYGVSGGFSSVQGGQGGSIQDSYDRLSGQLAGLGQKAKERQDQAGSEAQSLEQEAADREIEFQNQQALLRDAIYKGDVEAASSIYQNLMKLKSATRSQLYQKSGDVIKGVGKSAITGAI